MNESLVKYLAGLLDADGCLSYNFRESKSQPGQYHVGLRLVLSAAQSIDKHGFVESLPVLTGMGTTCRIPPNQTITSWAVAKRPHLEMLLPRLIKHMVIKARHWQWLLETWRQYRGQEYGENGVSAEERNELSRRVRESRKNVGPLKPKNHPTWAWLAGYLDGDGYYILRTDQTNRNYVRVGVCAHKDDASVLGFLQNAFGGTVGDHKKPPLMFWDRNLALSQASFALNFLPNLVKHSRLKKHKIEAMIHWHRQRLNLSSIVCSMGGCEGRKYANQLCKLHYERAYRAKRNGVSDSLST